MKPKRLCIRCNALICECKNKWLHKFPGNTGVCVMCATKNQSQDLDAKIEIEEARKQVSRNGTVQ